MKSKIVMKEASVIPDECPPSSTCVPALQKERPLGGALFQPIDEVVSLGSTDLASLHEKVVQLRIESWNRA